MDTTREKLYNEVWAEAVTTVAKRYGVSDNAVRKKCKAYNIPLPDNAYWGKFRAGKNPLKKPLPNWDGGDSISFVGVPDYYRQTSKSEPEEPKPLFFEYPNDERNNLMSIYNAISVKEKLTQPHELVTKHQDAIKNNKMQDYIRNTEKIDYQGLHIKRPILNTHSVSMISLPRVFRFLDALFKAAEKAGCSVKPISDSQGSHFIVKGHKVSFSLKEKYKRHEKENPGDRWGERYDYTPSGIVVLTFQVENIRQGRYSPHEWTWTDTKTKQLSDKIKDVFVCLMQVPEYIEQRKKEYMTAQELQRKNEEIRQQAKALHDEELTKARTLIENSIMWEKAESVRKYIRHLKDTDAVDDEDWLNWASNKADWLDPTINVEDDILSEDDKYSLTHKKEEKSYGYDYYSSYSTSAYYKKPWYLKNRK